MGNKWTEESYRARVNEITNGEIIVLGNYINQNTAILHKHNVQGCVHQWYPKPKHILYSNSGCPECRGGVKKSHKKYVRQLYEISNGEYEIVSEYKGDKEVITLKHVVCGKLFDITAGEILNGGRCTKCFKLKRRANNVTDEIKVAEITQWLTKNGYGEIFNVIKAWRVPSGNLWTWHINVENMKYKTVAEKSLPAFKIGIEKYGQEYLAKSNPQIVTEEEKKIELIRFVEELGLQQCIEIDKIDKIKTPKGTPFWKVKFRNKKYDITENVLEYTFKKGLPKLREDYLPTSNMANKTFEKKLKELKQFAKRYQVENVFEFEIIEKVVSYENRRVKDWKVKITNTLYDKAEILGITAIKKGIKTHRNYYLSSDNMSKYFIALGSKLEEIIFNMLRELKPNIILRNIINIDNKTLIPDYYLEEDSQIIFMDSKLTYDTAVSVNKRAKDGYLTTHQRYEPYCDKLLMLYLIGDKLRKEISQKTTLIHVDYLLSGLSLEKKKQYKEQLEKLEEDYYKFDIEEATLHFSPQEIEDIFSMYLEEKNMNPISIKYDTPVTAIHRILRRKSYKFVNIDESLIQQANDILDGIDKLKFLPLIEDVFKDYVRFQSSRQVAELPKYNTNPSVIRAIIKREIYSYVKIDKGLEKQAQEILQYNKGSLKEEQVIWVFNSVVKGMSTRKVAKELGISRGMISNILNRKSYLNIRVPETLVKHAQTLIYERDASKEERHKRFSKEEVLDIVNKFVNEKMSVTEISELYKRNKTTIYDVLNRKSYKNIKIPIELEEELYLKLVK
ncbi:hypothetical protein COF04_03715 [Bacillus toyonensis]|uniref:hypothetical protein n=1 Tax=Bacillus toyonensis TaxID=155322 RepID=UPI000BFC7850|nr:hypothetical protein [Bacillus toyonensis]PHC05694.1 hypothetical protein COF04_03715 [Bacillus toyonensis]